MTDQEESLTFVALSDEGEVLYVPAPTMPAPPFTPTMLFNIQRNTETDDFGHSLRSTVRYPDGHFCSPFRSESWEVMPRAEYEARGKPSKETLETCAARRAENQARSALYADRSLLWCASIGRFVVHYESMCTALLRLVRGLLAKGGLQSERAADAVIADQTAQPLSDLAWSLFRALIPMEAEDKKIGASIFKRVNACIQVRNFVLHSAWYFGGTQPPTSAEFALASAQKFRKSKQDPTRRSMNFTREMLDGYAIRCLDARTLVTDLCVVAKRGRALSSFLKVGEGEALERILTFEKSMGRTLVEPFPPIKEYELPRTGNDRPLDMSDQGPRFGTASLRDVDLTEYLALMGRVPET